MKKLADYIEEKGLRQDKFAKKIGVTPSMLSSVLSGKRSLSKKHWKKVVEATNGEITLEDLIEDYIKDIDAQE